MEKEHKDCQILGMHHVSMKCADKVLFEKAVAFYKDILGFSEERRWAEGVMLKAGAGTDDGAATPARLEIFCNGEGIHELGAIRHFALETKNVDELAAKVKAAGYQVFIEPKDITIASQPPFHARMAFFYGPLGEQVELFNPDQASATPATPSNIQVLRASEEWQRAGAYSVRIEGMNRQHHIPLRDEFDEHDCDGTKYIVLLDDGYPVATCRFYENDSTNEQANLSVTLGRVVVLPQYRGLGLGKKVVTEAEVWAKELGYKQIDIDSRVEAIHFYEKLGYQHATCNDDIIKSGSFECVQMYKEL